MNRALPLVVLATLGCSSAKYVSKPADLGLAVVTVRAGSATGTAAVARPEWHLTAAHVVKRVRTVTQSLDPQTGLPVTRITFAPVTVVQTSGDGSTATATADVFRYSSADNGEDIAVLRVRDPKAFTRHVRFDLSGKAPAPGDALYYVGYLSDYSGAEQHQSLCEGVVSFAGRRIQDRVFDQGDFTAVGGSSGGPVFRKRDGVYVGMLTQGPKDTVNYFVPARRIVPWLKKVGCEFIVDPRLDVPGEDELKRMAVDQSDLIEVPKE